VENVWLDELHGLRISISGHYGKWPISTIKFAERLLIARRCHQRRLPVDHLVEQASGRGPRLLSPIILVGGVRLTGGFVGVLAGMVRADLHASDAISENSSSVWTAHRAITAALSSPSNATRI